MAALPIGKLPARLLAELLDRYPAVDERLVAGPGVGQDVALLDLGDRLLAAKTDPITFATDEIGWYAVHVNANDVACCGAAPRWFLATILLPERDASPELADRLFGQLDRACRQLGVTLCGGHTEITHGLTRTIIVGQMLGEVSRDRYVTTAGVRAGDALILTKGIAVEGTALIAREMQDGLKELLPDAEIARLADFLHRPGISVVRDARVALDAGGVHALHDPTEGGVATGLWEMAQAAGVGLVVDRERLPILPECRLLCRHFGLDPLGLIGSGALLIAAEPERAAPIVARLQAEGVSAAIIGWAAPAERGCVLRDAESRERPLPQFARDEIARLFES